MKGINIEEINDRFDVSFSDDSVEYDINNLDLQMLKIIEEGAISGILDQIQHHILTLPFIRLVLVKELEEGLEQDCTYIYDYADNMTKVRDSLRKFIQVSENGVKNKTNHELLNSLAVGVADVRKSYNEMSVLMYKLQPIYTTACKVEEFGLNDVSKECYLEVVTELNNKIAKIIDNVDKFAGQTTGHFVGNPNFYGELAKIFRLVTENMDIKYLQRIDLEDNIETKLKPIVPQKSQSEIERESFINKANDLYNQLCLDWIRDLEKQVPHSSKDRYKAFIAKFNKFNETFEMPLMKTTTLGKAKEACNQINNLMNYISDISSEAYTTSVYDEK